MQTVCFDERWRSFIEHIAKTVDIVALLELDTSTAALCQGNFVSSKDPFKSFLGETLAMIDERFSKDDRPLHERPFVAAQIVVEFFIESIEGDTKEGYLTKPWFGGIYKPVWDWYRARYGEALISPKEAVIRGLVYYFGSPLMFRLPLVIHESEKNGTTWMRFPKEVFPTEAPLSWLENAPPIDEMPQKRRAALENSIREAANLLRAVNNDLNTAGLSEVYQRSLVRTIVCHLEKAAIDEMADEENTRSLAVWELQMACEKVMKVYLSQSGVSVPETHNLRDLQKLANVTADFSEAKAALAAFPSASRVISWRYSEIPPPSHSDFQRMYTAALALCGVYSSMMRRKWVFNNFAVQLKKPAWSFKR